MVDRGSHHVLSVSQHGDKWCSAGIEAANDGSCNCVQGFHVGDDGSLLCNNLINSRAVSKQIEPFSNVLLVVLIACVVKADV